MLGLDQPRLAGGGKQHGGWRQRTSNLSQGSELPRNRDSGQSSDPVGRFRHQGQRSWMLAMLLWEFHLSGNHAFEPSSSPNYKCGWEPITSPWYISPAKRNDSSFLPELIGGLGRSGSKSSMELFKQCLAWMWLLHWKYSVMTDSGASPLITKKRILLVRRGGQQIL